MRNILLAIDGSEHAMAAIKLVQNLQLPETCKLSILTVLIPRNAQHHAALEHLMEHTKILFQAAGLQSETHLLTGYPAEQIIDFAQVHKPDLIVMGAKGLRGTLRILLGGVAQQVVEYAQCPVLIVRAPHTNAKNVLLVTDGSEHSQWAITHLGQCSLPIGAMITAMHVLPPETTSEMLMRSWPYGMEVIPPVFSEDLENNLVKRAVIEEQNGRELLNKTMEESKRLGFAVQSVLRRGDAATEILNYAQENDIDLIIAGSRGLSQVRSWLLGSVSSKLTHYAACSVMIVKNPGIKET